MKGLLKLEDCKSFEVIESSFELLRSEENELINSFDELISSFLKETCSKQCFRPVPPKLGNGCFVDLLKLYFVVRMKGGFDSVSRKKVWDEVSVLYGLGPKFGSALKLIYLKYLDSLEVWCLKLSSNEGLKSGRFCTGVWSKGALLVIGLEYGRFVLSVKDEMRKSEEGHGLKEEKSGISFIDLTGDETENENENENENLNVIENGNVKENDNENDNENKNKNENENDNGDWNKFVTSFEEDGFSTEENEDADEVKEVAEVTLADGVGFSGDNHDENFKQIKCEMAHVSVVAADASDDGKSSVGPVAADIPDNVVKSPENSYESKKCPNANEELIMDSSVMKEVSSNKRKRDHLSDLLDWVVYVAKNPVDPDIGSIPESYSWEAYGNDNCWKQVLLARAAIYSKKIEHLTYQKKQKMHPSMYADDPGSFERLDKPGSPPSFKPSNPGRPRQRLEARRDMQPTASIYTSRPSKRIPVGIDFQADVPEWTGVVVESDLKWLGTQVWPLEEKEDNLLVERDSIGKGRLNPCGCLFPGTTECVKFHVSKRRMTLKSELASAFDAWKFDTMGEECRASWTSEEENKFKLVVKDNPFSQNKRFWKLFCEAIPEKSWSEQVNYYFNVFVVQRRAFQNRFTPRNIDSDDDETEYGLVTNTHRHRTESGVSPLRSWLNSSK